MEEEMRQPQTAPSASRLRDGVGQPPSRSSNGGLAPEAIIVRGTITSKRKDGRYQVKLDSGDEILACPLFCGSEGYLKLGPGTRVGVDQGWIVKRLR